MDNLKYFKEPIFIWTNLPDEQANVIVTYIQGSLLPIVCLLLTSMVTSYLSKEENSNSFNKQISDKPEYNKLEKIEGQNILSEENTKIEDSIEEQPKEQIKNISLEDEKKDKDIEKPAKEELIEEEPTKEEYIKEEPVQQTQQIETPLDLQSEQHKYSKPSHFINL